MAEDFVRAAKDGAYLKLRVSPGAKSTGIKGLYGEGALKLSVAAPPTDGRANAEVERFLAGLLGLPKGDVSVVKGASSRDKLVFVSGAKPETVLESKLSAISRQPSASSS